MITRVVNANYEATIPLVVQAIYGQEEAIEAVIDTGFTGSLTLPPPHAHHGAWSSLAWSSTSEAR